MTVRVAMVGCGTVARLLHLPGLRAAGADVVAFASRRRSSAEAAAAEWGGGAVVDDWRDAVARDDVDAVTVCSPNAFHAEQAVAAARAGKHVLVEKPIATTLAEADAMVAAARDAGVVLMTAHNLRFAAPFVAAAGVVAGGGVGDVVGVRVAFGHAGPQHWAPDADWFFDPDRSGGGALIDLGIHAADLLRAVLAPLEVVEVAAVVRDGPAVDEAAQLALGLSNGAVGSLHASWIARPGPDHQLTVFGTDATLHLDGRTPLTRFPADGGAPERVDLPERVPDLFAGFVAAAADGTPPPVTGADGRAALAIVSAAYESARTGRTATVEPPA
jgi:predicted dehydrogenase